MTRTLQVPDVVHRGGRNKKQGVGESFRRHSDDSTGKGSGGDRRGESSCAW